MARKIRFLTEDDALAMQVAIVAMWGGHVGVRDKEKLGAAIAMPQQTFEGEFLHAFPFEMASAYAFHVAEGQVFLDGNKRTGLMLALTFLRLNGITIAADDPTVLERAMVGLSDRSVSKSDLAEILKSKAFAITTPFGPWLTEDDVPEV